MLVTVDEARRDYISVWIACLGCGRGSYLDPSSLTTVRPDLALGELWLAGRFKCGGCGRPASHMMTKSSIEVALQERWGLDVPLVGERLRRHWRAQP